MTMIAGTTTGRSGALPSRSRYLRVCCATPGPPSPSSAMPFFEIRRARVRPEFAKLYPEVVSGVWISARKATRVVQRHPKPRGHRPVPDDGRVLPDLHFEFQGGRRTPQDPSRPLTPRAEPRLK